jgi:hypothetical protein
VRLSVCAHTYLTYPCSRCLLDLVLPGVVLSFFVEGMCSSELAARVIVCVRTYSRTLLAFAL